MSSEAAEQLPERRRSIRGPLVWTGLVLLVAGAAGAVLWLAYGRTKTDTSATTAAPTTSVVPVGRRNLAETQTFSGTLGYADPRTVSAQTQGTLTAIAPEGSVRTRGQVLFRVNDLPTVLMYGTVPMWRALSSGVADGPDVRELEWNLVALGYDPNRDITIDDTFTSATTAAIDRWQAALGETQTGTVALGDVVFLPGKRRIGQAAAAVGSTVQPGSQVLTATRTNQQVTVQLDATDQTLAVVGRRVTVDLPDGSAVPGRITTVGTVAQSSSSTSSTGSSSTGSSSATGSSSSSSSSTATIEVDIALLRPAGESLDQAPVDVNLTTESRRHVVAVPVTALLALLGGGYAVEVPSGTGTRLVAVKPGLYGGGYVEITSGLRPGDRVVVPQQQ